MLKTVGNGISIRTKLLLPVALFLAMVIVSAVIYYALSSEIAGLRSRQQAVTDLADQMRTTSLNIEAFLNGRLEYEALEKNFQVLADLQTLAGMETGLDEIRKRLSQFNELTAINTGIEKDLWDLTAESIKQSDGFIKTMSEKLADETTRQEVSTLERLVIAGAAVNTTSNYELRILFLRLKENSAVKDALLAFLEKLIANTAKDMESLKNTPFLGMAQAAQIANKKVKEMSLTYIANVDEQLNIIAAVRQAMTDHIDEIDQVNLESSQNFFHRVISSFRLLLLVVIIVGILGILFSWFIGRSIVGPIKSAMRLAQTIQSGDLSQRLAMNRQDEIGQMTAALDAMADGLEGKATLADHIGSGDLTREISLSSEADALGRALRKMDQNLNTVLSQINEAVEKLNSGATQVSDSSQSLSQGATEQAAALEQITSSITELSSQTKSNAENAAQANTISLDAREGADTGNRQMTGLVSAMAEISGASKEIAKIVKTIDDIAFQTNLLALNAAVEAARAGKHGKGFAVVAQEVRNLAGRSAKAAGETADLIEGTVRKIENGTDMVDATAQSLIKIVEGTTKVADLIGEIAASSNEQAQGIAQINQGLSQVEQVTQQNTANAEQTASAAEELSSQALQLRQLVARFKLKEQRGTSSFRSEPENSSAPQKPYHSSVKVISWENDKKVKPGDVISLDDGDFGKY